MTPAVALLRNRHLLILAILLLALAGLSAWSSLPRIEDPRIVSRYAFVVTPYPGASAARVEALVTKPLEDAIREVAEVKVIDSTSSGDLSAIGVELDDAVTAADNERLFSELRDKLAEAAATLPAGAGPPLLDSERGAVAFSLVVALAWTGEDANAAHATPAPLGLLTRLAEELADDLRALPGTERVVRFGAAEEEIRVEVQAADLAAAGLTLEQLAARLSAADAKAPAGAVYGDGARVRLSVAGELDSVQRISTVPVLAADGRLLQLGDVAKVHKTWREPPLAMAAADGQRAILLGVRTRAALDLQAWSDAARARVAAFAATLHASAADGDLSVQVLFEQNRYTSARLAELGGNLLAGALVVMAVVWLSMGWRPALIVGSALPLSAAVTLLGLDLVGQQIHQITIFGMIIAIGLLIDNAIVVTDEVRKQRARGLTPDAAVAAGIRHLFGPLAASTFTTALGFMPILLRPGNVGDFVGPIATAVILALGASFLISMSIIPALAGLSGPSSTAGQAARWWRDGLSHPGLAAAYRALLTALLRRPLLAALACLPLPLAGILAVGQMGLQFFPPADRDQFEVQLWNAPSASIADTAAAMAAVETVIRDAGAVRQLFWVAGASSPPVYYNQLRLEDNNPAYARATVTAASVAEARRLVAVLQQGLPERFPTLRLVVRAFGQGPPIAAPIALRLLGPDSDALRRLGEEVRALIHRLPEVTESRASIGDARPRLTLQANEQQARLLGLRLNEIASQFRAALDGVEGGQVLEDVQSLPVRVRWAGPERADLARLATLPLIPTEANPAQSDATSDATSDPLGGTWIPAAALGPLSLEPEIASITRRDGERVNIIEAWLRADSLPIEVTARLRQQIAEAGFALPSGYRLEFAGDSEEQGEAIGLLLAYAPLLGALMLATLVLAFRSFSLAALIALVGLLSVALGMLALWLSGWPLGFNPVLGSAGLIGVAINDSIVVLAAIRAHPAAAAGDIPAMVDAINDATRHIISTTLTTVGGFLPLILFSGGAFWPPLAIVIAGGVGLSLPLGLIFAPAVYRLLVRTGWVRQSQVSHQGI
jgi:multidrug efflux pump subunit AcrB